ncbi:hypothetical protein [Herbaspirillum huttiense]|uniref:Uncharacterized protein n=1 Tax=Herbaspirillum huttiense subsp. lycopersici TaxID=3074428 RepID=A0ABU2EG03_9BURK|nr:hypothetical protein [Herbaspirillum huttiense]MDR9847063.1 hypothetical protein [Herbaspirillum huttiense SE1]
MAYTVIRGKLVKMERSWRTGNKSLAVTIREHTEAEQKKALKGVMGGNCNVTACQKPGATWWNIGSRAYYCRSCAEAINRDGCRRYGEPDICFPSMEEGEAAKEARYEAQRKAREAA